MPLVSFRQLMAEAARGGYAVGYFESWNLESIQAVAAAAEAVRSPVILGFGGIHWPGPTCPSREHLSLYAALGLAACRRLMVPACLIFNESSHLDWVLHAVELGFSVVMFADDELGLEQVEDRVREVARRAHAAGAAVEAELASLPGVGHDLRTAPDDRRLTDPDEACAFVERTGVDALAVNVGQVHVHGRAMLRLDLSRLRDLVQAVPVPLVLHGASSIDPEDLRQAVRLGVRKVNVGSALRRACLEAVRAACAGLPTDYNPYEAIGSGRAADVLRAGQAAVQRTVEGFMHLVGSAGRA